MKFQTLRIVANDVILKIAISVGFTFTTKEKNPAEAGLERNLLMGKLNTRVHALAQVASCTQQ